MYLFANDGTTHWVNLNSVGRLSNLTNLHWKKARSGITDISHGDVEGRDILFIATKNQGIFMTTSIDSPLSEWKAVTDQGLSGYKAFISIDVDSNGVIYAAAKGNSFYKLERVKK